MVGSWGLPMEVGGAGSGGSESALQVKGEGEEAIRAHWFKCPVSWQPLTQGTVCVCVCVSVWLGHITGRCRLTREEEVKINKKMCILEGEIFSLEIKSRPGYTASHQLLRMRAIPSSIQRMPVICGYNDMPLGFLPWLCYSTRCSWSFCDCAQVYECTCEWQAARNTSFSCAYWGKISFKY